MTGTTNGLRGHSPATRAFIVLAVVAIIIVFTGAAICIALQWWSGTPAGPVVWLAAISYFCFTALRGARQLFADLGDLS